jgi:hypothetical protein
MYLPFQTNGILLRLLMLLLSKYTLFISPDIPNVYDCKFLELVMVVNLPLDKTNTITNQLERSV